MDVRTDIAREVMGRLGLKRVHLCEGDFLANGFSEGAFDLVVAASVFEHFPDTHQLIGQVRRILAPGGRLIFLSPTETMAYRAGRRALGFTKPADHYFSAREIAAVTAQHLTGNLNWPVPMWLPRVLAPYRAYLFVKQEHRGQKP